VSSKPLGLNETIPSVQDAGDTREIPR
jgi:hypothetical protein